MLPITWQSPTSCHDKSVLFYFSHEAYWQDAHTIYFLVFFMLCHNNIGIFCPSVCQSRLSAKIVLPLISDHTNYAAI